MTSITSDWVMQDCNSEHYSYWYKGVPARMRFLKQLTNLNTLRFTPIG